MIIVFKLEIFFALYNFEKKILTAFRQKLYRQFSNNMVF